MGLIQEASWTEGGHRLYDETVFERLWQIQQLRETKSLSEIRDLFRSAQVVKAS
jgi:DNA-binding transcriptional MerR regulator